MKPMDHQRVQRLIEDIGSLLTWHEYHQRGRKWSECTVENEVRIADSLHVMQSVIQAQLLPNPEGSDGFYRQVAETLQCTLTWHQLHKKDGCYFRTQGEDGHIEWLANTLYDITQEPQYTAVIIDALRTKLAEARPDLLRLFPEIEEG